MTLFKPLSIIKKYCGNIFDRSDKPHENNAVSR